MRAATCKIRTLIDSGALLDKNRHHYYVDIRLRLIKSLQFTEWASIESDSNGSLFAIRWIEKEQPKPNTASKPHVTKTTGAQRHHISSFGP